eukprot:6462249-Amphidinium_carterae.1
MSEGVFNDSIRNMELVYGGGTTLCLCWRVFSCFGLGAFCNMSSLGRLDSLEFRKQSDMTEIVKRKTQKRPPRRSLWWQAKRVGCNLHAGNCCIFGGTASALPIAWRDASSRMFVVTPSIRSQLKR